MKKSIPIWQLGGLVFVSVTGTLLHFLYDWTGESVAVGIFCAVNESIWEHIKLLYFPMLLYSFIEARFISDKVSNYWCAKLAGALIGIVLIPVMYYTYSGILGKSADWFNILIFFISAGVAYYIETKLMLADKGCRLSNVQIILILLIIGAVFVLLTFKPPHIPLFRDPIDKTYGIKKELH